MRAAFRLSLAGRVGKRRPFGAVSSHSSECSQSASIFKSFRVLQVPLSVSLVDIPLRTVAMVTHINDKNDLLTKLTDAGDQLVVIDFFATWCGPCKMIAPKLAELAQEFQNVLVFKVDVDECEDIAMEYNISSMPTFVFIKNNQTITQFSGANYDKLRQLVVENK